MVPKHQREYQFYRKTTIYVPTKKVYYEVFILTNWKRNQQCDR